MSRAREIADLGSPAASGLSNRNLIINGDMQVWQRATAATAGANNTINTTDRWGWLLSNDGAVTSEQSTDTPTGTGYSFLAKCTTADTSIAAAQYASIFQNIEAQNLQPLQYGTSSAKTITLSFWVKSNKTGTYTVAIYKSGNTGYIIPNEYTISSANTWEKKTITITPTAGSTSFITASAGALLNTNALGFQVAFNLAFGSNFHGTNNTWSSNASHYSTSNQVNWLDSTSNNFYLSQVQLEIGDVATPFEHEDYGTTLAKCQRYFIKSGNLGTANEWFPGVTTYADQGNIYAQSLDGNQDRAPVHVRFPSYMRSAPTIVYYPGRSGVANTAGSITVYNGNTLVTTSTKPTGGVAGLVGRFTGTSTDAIAYTYQFTANAEL